MGHICPNCGYEFGIDEAYESVCKDCGFDFGTTITCSYLHNGKCLETSEPCTVKGLDFEDCKVYLHTLGL